MSCGGGLWFSGGARRPRPGCVRCPVCLLGAAATSRAERRGRYLVPRCADGVMCLKVQAPFTYFSF